MNKVKKNLDNQAIGLLPLVLFMFLDNFFSYLFSFVIALSFCMLCFLLYWRLQEKNVYQFMFLPTILTFALYTCFFFFRLRTTLFVHSPLIVEMLLVVSLALFSFSKRIVLHHVRHSNKPTYKRIYVRATLNEFFFVAQLVQSIYTLHLFSILIYSVLPMEMHGNLAAERLLYREMPWFLGVSLLIYEQIRVFWMSGSLEKEMWLPVLNDEGKVVGCMARSVSRALPKKYYHPVIRVAVLYQGMIYLVKRSSEDFVSSNTLDHPLHGYMLFRHSHVDTLRTMLGRLADDPLIEPHCLIRYTFETHRVKHLVFLYTIRLENPEQLAEVRHSSGKLWTVKQIKENIGKNVFSGYFEQEYPYLRNTALMEENFQ
ncbi:MAG: hypothetical protein ACI3ZY_08080 [Parabacteroides sp.]